MSDLSVQIELARRFIAHDIRAPLMKVQRDADSCRGLLKEAVENDGLRGAKRTMESLQTIEDILRNLYDEKEAERLFEMIREEPDREQVHKELTSFVATIFHNIADCCTRMRKLQQYRCLLAFDSDSELLIGLSDFRRTLLSLRIAVLDFRNLVRKKLDHITQIDIVEVIQRIVKLKTIREQAGLELNFVTGPGASLVIDANPAHFTFVFRQIISNSLKNAGAGRLRIRISGSVETAVPTHMNGQFLATPPAPFVCLTFEDTGLGMNDDALAVVRAALAKESDDNTPIPEIGANRGTGLGLKICRQVVGLYCGEIGVDSKLDQGTSVFFLLPQSSGVAQ